MIADGKELIALISEIRSQYNCFDNADQKYYEALSLVLRILRHLPSEQPCDDAVSRAAAIDAVKKNSFRLTFAEEQGCEGHVVWSAYAVYSDVMEGALLELPSAQPHDIARDIATIIENEKDMRVILKNAQPDAPDTNGGDIIYRQAAIDAVSNWLYDRDDGRSVDQLLSTLPSVQPLVIHCTDCEDWLERQSILGFTISELPSVQPEPEWNNHTVACLLAELFGDTCACNYNGIDEWLPEKCEVIDACPNPVGVACWEQFLKHRAERRQP